MNNYAKARKLIEGLAETLTLQGLKLDDENHSCMLLFEGDIVLNIEYDDPEGRLVLSIYLGELPDVGAEPLLRELMGANLYWHRTAGATLCLEEDSNAVMLVYGHSVGQLQPDVFENIIENLIKQAEHWQQRIKLVKAEAANSIAGQAAHEAQSPGRTDGFIFG
jgi:hypothetical protein